jgi:CRP-like cAMP-binding protein
MEQSISIDGIIAFLVSTPLFEGLDPVERADVARILEVTRFRADETVFREGEAGDAWYVIASGTARVVKQGAGGSTELARLNAGDCFGEMAILDGSPRSATIEAATDVTLYRFRRARFEDLLDQGSLGAYKLVLAMARTLSVRQRELSRRMVEMQSASVVTQYLVSE